MSKARRLVRASAAILGLGGLGVGGRCTGGLSRDPTSRLLRVLTNRS
jgi:hypothetical protein